MRSGTAEFSAHPRKIFNREGPKGRQTFYRDPMRDLIRVAPQNIMYDRRIVRGNTFAALVIPVSKILFLKLFRHATRASATSDTNV